MTTTGSERGKTFGCCRGSGFGCRGSEYCSRGSEYCSRGSEYCSRGSGYESLGSGYESRGSSPPPLTVPFRPAAPAPAGIPVARTASNRTAAVFMPMPLTPLYGLTRTDGSLFTHDLLHLSREAQSPLEGVGSSSLT